MKFEEALKELKEGKTIRRNDWNSHIFLIIKNKEILFLNDSYLNPVLKPINADGYDLDSDDLLAEDWEMVK